MHLQLHLHSVVRQGNSTLNLILILGSLRYFVALRLWPRPTSTAAAAVEATANETLAEKRNPQVNCDVHTDGHIWAG